MVQTADAHVWPTMTGEESSTGPWVPNDHCFAPVIVIWTLS